jgi:hypothetical protein
MYSELSPSMQRVFQQPAIFCDVLAVPSSGARSPKQGDGDFDDGEGELAVPSSGARSPKPEIE